MIDNIDLGIRAEYIDVIVSVNAEWQTHANFGLFQ